MADIKLLIIAVAWTPYNHARFTAVARYLKNTELTVFFQNTEIKYRKWNAEMADASYRMVLLKNIGIPVSANTAFVCNINYTIYSEIKRLAPDRIIVMGWDSLATLTAVLYALRHNKEIVLWAESTIFENSLIRKVSLGYVKFILRYFDGYISGGTAAAEYLRLLGVRKKIEPFYNSVDVDHFVERGSLSLSEKQTIKKKIGVESRSRVILFSGRLVAIKRVDLLIKAFFEVSQRFKDIELLIAGYGPEEGRLKQMAGTYHRIHFIGHQGIDRIPEVYGISDILVLPSVSEPWGLVVNEAMACGCAIVVSDRCGCSRDIIQGNGIVVAGGELAPLVDALDRLLSSESRLSQMKEKSLEIIGSFRNQSLVRQISFFRD